MDEKLELLLKKINLNEDFYNYFSGGKILNIKSSQDKLNCNFLL